ncbi:nicotinate-nucleotide--dimethylbenzimidazole phosphoribosyltransferase [Marinifilum breve]|uniref:Nicotinate-nucleotide--dimethylbenzimidazole phosphoribosyltransferase n=2 Tax=Marinifilum TaxID=866673 RepID=A0A419WT80_9BACT|nr:MULTISPECIES: nicotinate-nucleotide--dimethylbenzimidazole phosphoribosyltransferase [Marinifilum]PXY01935.1 nicotinate-nucleotide--dimethylbenzimidazole phosphoribosyltransferase [Marinifilum breve]RKD98647.1 nicotinate-nucleotide-dimethylbenzimidazole phosphoribosyltransferase [Marinifilum flexuosum]
MIEFKIDSLSDNLNKELQEKIDTKTKPIGSLGMLEKIAFQLGKIQNSLNPTINNPNVVVFAGDHGIADDGVSFYPKSVSYQMLYNYMEGGAASTVFAKQHGIKFNVVDAGVDHDFDPSLPIINRKLAYGTKNYRLEPAMTKEQCLEGIKRGAEVIEEIHQNGCNFIIFGEKGIGNTSSASLILSLLGDISLEECVGRGTGLDKEGVKSKFDLLNEGLSKYNQSKDPIDVLTHFGGFEIVMIVGAMLKAAELKMTLLIDGFIITSALLAAFKINPKVKDYCLFAHKSNEQAHIKMLNIMGGEPILDISMRLGEATGAMVCFPLIKSAAQFMNEMASFQDAGVSEATEEI